MSAEAASSIALLAAKEKGPDEEFDQKSQRCPGPLDDGSRSPRQDLNLRIRFSMESDQAVGQISVPAGGTRRSRRGEKTEADEELGREDI
jgi:hypothetical protein